jgi:biopolymer transport protein ExbD
MLLRRQVSEERDEHIDMTPMVDVVFQLMTFMLFSVQMTGGEEVDVPPAKYGVGVEQDAATFISMLKPAQPGGEPRFAIGLGDGPPATLDAIRKAVSDGVAQGRKRVILQADGAVPHSQVVELAANLADIEGITLHIGVQEYLSTGGP